MMSNIAVIILAAGKGTRIKSSNNRNKVAYELAGKPMVTYAVELFERLRFKPIIVVVGYGSQSVEKAVGDRVMYALQRRQLGTGHALKMGLQQVPAHIKHVISAYGDDSAFYAPELLQALVKTHLREKATITFVTVTLPDPTGLGRIVRDSTGKVIAIVEDKNATPWQKRIREINTGLYCFNRQFADFVVSQLKKNPLTHEYYLTDIIEIALTTSHKVVALNWPDNSIWYGVNTKAQLLKANKLMRSKVVI